MSIPILATKIYIPSPPPKAVTRSRLLGQLDSGLHHKLIIISAPAGFGKSTLVSEWIASRKRPAAWLSLDENDNDTTRFLRYCIEALRTISLNLGAGILDALQSSQIPPTESILTALVLLRSRRHSSSCNRLLGWESPHQKRQILYKQDYVA